MKNVTPSEVTAPVRPAGGEEGKTSSSVPRSAVQPARPAAGEEGKKNGQVFLLTGLSGAGKSTALKVLEDLRFLTIDGLPGHVAPDVVKALGRSSLRKFRGIALGLDIHEAGSLDYLRATVDILRKEGCFTKPRVIFLEASLNCLMRRYATTRRPHPLEREGFGLEAALKEEARRLAPLRQMADVVLNTSSFSIHDLRRAIQRHWHAGESRHTLKVNIVSFGFKYGVPPDADMVFDMRFLPNPYEQESLRPRSGKDPDVAAYVFQTAEGREFRKRFLEFLLFTLPLMEKEGRYRLTIAIGCTGGHHRSVAVAETLARRLRQAGYLVALEHTHLDRE